ncbi:hypothetical protein CYY_000876 [Polysphondylium violaceum]|uniref:SAM-dependent MTase RsmB/NOP-type domain-containing protein n=1 Tax=Polysphondylium violaceum TaxID=133409 RepID=A0A8J4QA47_9MYCE|nr:hypothetical protein CYY_000876 [Polysphondylium violaceum]
MEHNNVNTNDVGQQQTATATTTTNKVIMDNKTRDSKLKFVETEMNVLNLRQDCMMQFKEKAVYDHLLKYYTEDHLKKIQVACSQTQLYTSIRINSILTNRDQVITDLRNHFTSNNNNSNNQFTSFLSFTDILKEKNNGGNSIDNNADNDRIIKSLNNDTIFIKTEGPFIPLPEYPQIVVDLLCGESVLRGSHVFAPGVMASERYLRKGNLVSVFMDASNNGFPFSRGHVIDNCYGQKCVFVGNGVCQMDRNEMYQTKYGVAIEITERIWSCPPLNGVLPDKIFLQHLPSIITVYQLDPKPGEKILDMCAAPGGKTTLIASLLHSNKGNGGSTAVGDEKQATIIALDKNKSKVKKIEELCTRLSLDKYVKCLTKDSSKLLPQHVDINNPNNKDHLELFKEGSFDKILLDGPCSGLGARPRFREDCPIIDTTNTASFQRALLKNAIGLLKVGGLLVYSTCTINPCENEENVAFVLNNYPQMKLVSQVPHIGQHGLKGCGLSEPDRLLVQRFDPSDDSIGTIGFFIARFTKINTDTPTPTLLTEGV